MSCLNFKIELCPVLAIIHLKKSFITDTSGIAIPLSRSPEIHVKMTVLFEDIKT